MHSVVHVEKDIYLGEFSAIHFTRESGLLLI